MRDIGKNIRQMRSKNKLTQDELAEKLFVTRQTVSNYETGKSRPDIEMLVQISEILDCDINSLLYGPAAEPERKAEYRALIAGIAVCILSGLPFLFWEELHKMARYWQSGVSVTLKTLLLPFFLVVLGWTVMQAIGLISRPRPLNHRVCKYIYWLLLSITLLYFALMLPTAYHYIKASRVYSYIHSLPMIPPYGIHSSFEIMPQCLDLFCGYFSLFFLKHKWLFFALGIMLRLLKNKTKQIRIHAASIISALALSLIIFFSSDSSFVLQVPNPDAFADPPYGIVVELWVDEP